jgi:23S rRNA (uridine2552-2'-O)-methyltransferase
VVDLGCWPGGWLQVTAAAVGASGRVVGVDIAEIHPPLENANLIAIQGDIRSPEVIAQLLEKLGGPADVLLCDAAPKLTGIRDADRANEAALLEAVGAALPSLLRPGGDALIKILEGPEAQAIDQRIRALFERARSVRPEASRPGTSERYLLGFGFRGSPKRGKRPPAGSS